MSYDYTARWVAERARDSWDERGREVFGDELWELARHTEAGKGLKGGELRELWEEYRRAVAACETC